MNETIIFPAIIRMDKAVKLGLNFDHADVMHRTENKWLKAVPTKRIYIYFVREDLPYMDVEKSHGLFSATLPTNVFLWPDLKEIFIAMDIDISGGDETENIKNAIIYE